ncbi:hypothetical protein VTJ04DRAFT_9847 [Mycothermus thermophilus]|uniref:uncharacterized protein n=1 Tax=Humicola insolens TaxID=85995 RepID=UPI00374203E6
MNLPLCLSIHPSSAHTKSNKKKWLVGPGRERIMVVSVGTAWREKKSREEEGEDGHHAGFHDRKADKNKEHLHVSGQRTPASIHSSIHPFIRVYHPHPPLNHPSKPPPFPIPSIQFTHPKPCRHPENALWSFIHIVQVST